MLLCIQNNGELPFSFTGQTRRKYIYFLQCTLVVNLQPELCVHRYIASERLCLETIHFQYFSPVFQLHSISIKGAVIIFLRHIAVWYYRQLSGIIVTPPMIALILALDNLNVCNNTGNTFFFHCPLSHSDDNTRLTVIPSTTSVTHRLFC